MPDPQTQTRRAFLRFLAASPLLAGLDLSACTGKGDSSGTPALGPTGPLISRPEDALDVFDFRAVAQHNLPPAHWGYMATGVDSEATLRANEEGYARLYIRPRRLVNVTKIETRVTLFGREWPTPVFMCPVSGQMAFHPERELGSARAAKAKDTLWVLSTVANTSVEEAAQARGEPTWYQLYPTARWDVTKALVTRANNTGCPAIVVTVDLPADSNRITATRLARTDTRDCTACHGTNRDSTYFVKKPMFAGLSIRRSEMRSPQFDWDSLRRVRDLTRAKLLLKGITTREDAALALQAGIDGLVVSNHGGRAEESGRATIDSLPEVVEAVGGQIPVLVDGGVRRGNDVIKALARGAAAVGIGRPYVWGLAAFGQRGVEKVLDLLHAELERSMRLAGLPSISAIGPTAIGKA